MVKNIWKDDSWKHYVYSDDSCFGIKLRIDKDVDNKVRTRCLELIKYLKTNYNFPVEIRIHIKNVKFIIAKDGEKCHGIFWRIDNDFTCKPYIKIATNQTDNFEEEDVEYIIFVILHELTHYFQWINNVKLTPIGEERQASRYAYLILDEFYDSLTTDEL